MGDDVSLNYAPQTVTADEYGRIFEAERANVYPSIDAFEQRMGEAIDRGRLEEAARVLSCPMKAAPPNWQHGRVIYAVARQYFDALNPPGPVNLIDIGTAKGFSALCLEWARDDSQIVGNVTSIDVLPPGARVRRNTPAEVDGLRTLWEILAPWPEAKHIAFVEATGIDWLRRSGARVHVAFVDGKHTDNAVWHEGRILADRQQPGDVVIFDDWQVHGVAAAIKRLGAFYELEPLQAKPGRAYVIARRK